MKPSRRILLIVAVVAVSGLVGIRIVSRLLQSRAPASGDAQALIVRAVKVTTGEIIDQISISGTIRPHREVDIFPKSQGRVLTLNYEVGDKVKAGDVLAVIEHQEIELQVKSARASLAMAKTNENAAHIDLKRARELYVERAMAKTELEEFEQKYAVAKAQSLSALAQADIAAQQLQNAYTTSLINGTIIKRMTAVGANVSPQAPIYAVQDLSKLKLVTSVDAPTLVRLKKGSTATLKVAELDTDVVGHVSSVAPSLDQQSRRAEVEIEIDDQNGKLVPNMFIDGSLVLNRLANALIVPNGAVVLAQDQPFIFRLTNGKAEAVRAQIGNKDAHNTQIVAGLNEGDMIAVSGLDRLRDGLAITIEATK